MMMVMILMVCVFDGILVVKYYIFEVSTVLRLLGYDMLIGNWLLIYHRSLLPLSLQ